MRLAEYWSARRWRELLNLIEHLRMRRGTWLYHYIGNDDELLEALGIPDEPRTSGMPRAPLHEWNPLVEAAWSIEQAIRVNTSAVQNAYAKKPQKPARGHPGPDTAFHRVKIRTKQRRHDELVRRVLPHKYEQLESTDREG